MLELTLLDNLHRFPPPENALDDPNGLLAFGGDLSVERLMQAYQQGIFPWFNDGEPILWWSPDPRGIMELKDLHLPRSFKRFLRKHRFKVTLNHDFHAVIEGCASIPRKPAYYGEPESDLNQTPSHNHQEQSQTWITKQMFEAYLRLHQAGHAHSIEVWDNQQLVGGLYGVSIGAVFCGESMFHKASNASKLAYFHLVKYMTEKEMDFIDCQLQNPFLQSLGCKEVSRNTFLERLAISSSKTIQTNLWHPRVLSEKA